MPQSARRSVKQKLKRALVGGVLACSLLVPSSLTLYAPPIPVAERPAIRQHAQWVHELWLKNRVSRTALNRSINQAASRARRFPPLYHWGLKRLVKAELGREGSLEGQGNAVEDSKWPPALLPGAILIQDPKIAAHEFVHYVGLNHPETMVSHAPTAAAVDAYLNHESLVVGQIDDPVYLEQKGHILRMHCIGQAKVIYGHDLRKIETDFHHPTPFSQSHHNDLDSAGQQLGRLCHLEERRIRKPAYGLFVIRLVSQGHGVLDALERARQPDLERERQEFIRHNPVLDWSKSP